MFADLDKRDQDRLSILAKQARQQGFTANQVRLFQSGDTLHYQFLDKKGNLETNGQITRSAANDGEAWTEPETML